jgi:hypothetical protein
MTKEHDMTLSELANDPKAMSAFMGWNWETQTRKGRAYCGYRGWTRDKDVELTAEEVFQERWKEYIASISPRVQEQTHLRMVHECLRDGLGLKGKASRDSVAERIKIAIKRWPDLYSPFEEESHVDENQLCAVS